MVPSDGDLTTVYNATYNIDRTTYLVANMSMAWRTTYDANGNTTIAGARCSLYNTTQQSVVSFSMNRFHGPVAVVFKTAITSSTLRPGPPTHPCGIGFMTSLTERSNLFSLNETAGTFTPNSENVVNALEQILLNATVALISSMGHTTTVNPSVAEDKLVWVYHVQRLWINGEDSDLTFWDIGRATRNSELDAVVEGEKRGDTGVQNTVQEMDLEANTSGVFILARPRRKGSN
ncbi:uncharacterized protein ARMOST_18657 [Armillaria ostoyae]|uniref:Uncharacterized protein n=1 Tax=Armillaria ostoyae TaxID=47428 RepID=A0A284S2B8_ARMOS|nr:uncharacterized protein ARMOST_18657 [Armillaria ostoyae]